MAPPTFIPPNTIPPRTYPQISAPMRTDKYIFNTFDICMGFILFTIFGVNPILTIISIFI